MSHVLLVGFMGAGKSTVGRLLARRLGVPFFDLDRLIESEEGMSVADIFSAEGEAGFRDAESRVLCKLERAASSVVACGGGVVVREENRALLPRLGTVVFLRVEAETVFGRISDLTSRPLLASGDVEGAKRLMAERDPLYLSVADHIVNTEGKSPTELEQEIESLLERDGL